MMRSLVEKQRRYLNAFFDCLDLDEVQRACQLCLETTGLLLFTGVGKSGMIAEKIAMTLVSTGTRALYLPPTNLLHGDLGIVSEQDLLILLSKSGHTEELLQLLPHVKRRGARTLALVSHRQSPLARACDVYVHLPVERELCPFDLAPTTSTVVQLLFGDLLAVALMQTKGLSLAEYAKVHPAGSLGKKMTLTVKELMLTGDQIPFCRDQDRIGDVLTQLSDKCCGAMLVVDGEKRLVGIFTDGDLRRALQKQGDRVLQRSAKDLMNASPLSVTQDQLAFDAMKGMQKDPTRWVSVVPVMHEGQVVGILRMHDIVQAGVA